MWLIKVLWCKNTFFHSLNESIEWRKRSTGIQTQSCQSCSYYLTSFESSIIIECCRTNRRMLCAFESSKACQTAIQYREHYASCLICVIPWNGIKPRNGLCDEIAFCIWRGMRYRARRLRRSIIAGWCYFITSLVYFSRWQLYLFV